jgi:hypothetical protein
MPDGVDGVEPLLAPFERASQHVGVGVLEDQRVAGRPELGIGGNGGEVVDGGGAADRAGDRDREQRQHEDLLPPFAAEHPPDPPHHRPAGGDTAPLVRRGGT